MCLLVCLWYVRPPGVLIHTQKPLLTCSGLVTQYMCICLSAAFFEQLSRCLRSCRGGPDVITEFPRVDPVLYVKYCHLCSKYELICSFNTFCTCRHPYYVQTTYRTTYEFHFQLGFSRRVQAVTSLWSSLASRRPAGLGSVHYIFWAFSEL